MSLTTILLTIFTITATVSATLPPPLSPYNVLQQFGFPIGLLPKGAKSYELNNKTGEFKAYLSGVRSFFLQRSYELRYKPVTGGHISKYKLAKLQGVSVKVVLMWLDIVEVRRNGDKLEFSVGIKSPNFPIDYFSESPQCGCGFDCDDRAEDKMQLNSLVSSS